MAVENFISFKKLMIKRNTELNEEALKMMLQKEQQILKQKAAEEERKAKEAADAASKKKAEEEAALAGQKTALGNPQKYEIGTKE